VTAVLPGVQYHHERWDGSGYPEGLQGEAIPLLGRLLGIADYLDALTSSRAYRGAISIDAAVELVRQEAGKHFDPRIADAVVGLHKRGELDPAAWDDILPPARVSVAPPSDPD
jgi:putative two-component system response regulator